MNKKQLFDPMQCIKKLVSFSPRQFSGEDKARQYIQDTLSSFSVSYRIQAFQTRIPVISRARLMVDEKLIPCKGCCFIGGKIVGKDNIISSLISSQRFLYDTNINFNPQCKGISLSNFYFAPSVAVDTKGLQKVIAGKKVTASVAVRPQKHQSANIFVGNRKNPSSIVFVHYDSIETGAIDNASGVAVALDIIYSFPKILEGTLFVFSGNEELSYDQPVYWGRGFRAFEKIYGSIMESVKNIFIVDCVGNGKTHISQDRHIMPLAFPIKNIEKWKKKIFLLFGDLDGLMQVYHSNLDVPDLIEARFLMDAKRTLMSRLKYLSAKKMSV